MAMIEGHLGELGIHDVFQLLDVGRRSAAERHLDAVSTLEPIGDDAAEAPVVPERHVLAPRLRQEALQ